MAKNSVEVNICRCLNLGTIFGFLKINLLKYIIYEITKLKTDIVVLNSKRKGLVNVWEFLFNSTKFMY